MKVVKASNNKFKISLSNIEWKLIGKKAGWFRSEKTTNETTQNKELTPKEAYTWLTKVMPGCRNTELEKIIATSAKWAYQYAVNVIKGRFELGEKKILESEWADEYKELLKMKSYI